MLTGTHDGQPGIGAPRISVVVPTRNRPDFLARCVASILESDHDAFELLVIDQSDQPQPLPSDPRLVHLSSKTIGKSAALNAAARRTRAPVLAFTDDDCTVPHDWLQQAEAVLADHPDVSMICGDLEAIEHDPEIAMVPASSMGTFEIVQGTPGNVMKAVSGGDLVVRKPLFEAIEGFDEAIGPGARFPGGEEVDFYYRALRSGAAIARAPQLCVLHWGVRSEQDGSAFALVAGYQFGGGAIFAKHLMLLDRQIVKPAFETLFWGAYAAVRDRLRGRDRWLRLYVRIPQGMVAAFRVGVDRKHRKFKQARLQASELVVVPGAAPEAVAT